MAQDDVKVGLGLLDARWIVGDQALAAALIRWLDDDALRARLRRAALARRDTLTDWPVTTALLAGVLKEVAE
ncbi:[Protein-PII] uridylyltransferase [Micromonospora noduli]|nr:[Protein-PII] uridylyltransferase [Micromonospora noduli]